jgi:hypothetical protein
MAQVQKAKLVWVARAKRPFRAVKEYDPVRIKPYRSLGHAVHGIDAKLLDALNRQRQAQRDKDVDHVGTGRHTAN